MAGEIWHVKSLSKGSHPDCTMLDPHPVIHLLSHLGLVQPPLPFLVQTLVLIPPIPAVGRASLSHQVGRLSAGRGPHRRRTVAVFGPQARTPVGVAAASFVCTRLQAGMRDPCRHSPEGLDGIVVERILSLADSCAPQLRGGLVQDALVHLHPSGGSWEWPWRSVPAADKGRASRGGRARC